VAHGFLNTSVSVGRQTHPPTDIKHKYKVHICILFYVKWVPCHHGMPHPQVAARGDRLQIWRVPANILNKQSRIADGGGPPAWGVWQGANNPPP
jgi:hypothetical protein